MSDSLSNTSSAGRCPPGRRAHFFLPLVQSQYSALGGGHTNKAVAGAFCTWCLSGLWRTSRAWRQNRSAPALSAALDNAFDCFQRERLECDILLRLLSPCQLAAAISAQGLHACVWLRRGGRANSSAIERIVEMLASTVKFLVRLSDHCGAVLAWNAPARAELVEVHGLISSSGRVLSAC
jgi:hypothetical protein